MAGLIEAFTDSGLNLYAMLRNADRYVWKVTTNTWVAWVAADWATYAIPIYEDDQSGFYYAAVPPAIAAQRLTILVYNRLGGTYASSDQKYGNSTGIWDGTEWESGWSTPARTLTSMGGLTVDVTKINGNSSAAVKLAISADTMISGQAIAGTLSVSQMTTNLTYVTNKLLYGRVVYFVGGALAGQVAAISAYDGATKKLTFFTPITSAPVAGQSFIIV